MGLLVIQDMPSLPANKEPPNAEQQEEFARQLEILINQHKSYPSIWTWVRSIPTPYRVLPPADKDYFRRLFTTKDGAS